ncbi:DUF2249 domain-containing protein [Sediminibacterium soli]|uniref:DUF2249 domain-containing protein n=1 Tax=Sediminibacterium soli TaxID=2698829 RepID=UPI00137B10ED|nr:DUF2249 domain-containing protein [Sediminibacterium soli]NCI46276.1 DUF2249 domain-containing protein [Sediminibacterium soli]
MKTVNAATKIAALIQADPAAIDAIAEINPHFKKLRNPVLRKMLASRVTIADAARIGKCSVEDFFAKLRPRGFVVGDEDVFSPPAEKPGKITVPDRPFDLRLDVRADIENGHDPFRKIMHSVSALEPGQTLLLINLFEPVPLIRLLRDKQYTAETVQASENEVHTYISRGEAGGSIEETAEAGGAFDTIRERFANRMQVIDVRDLPMPQPMMTILNALESLPDNTALFVHHKRIPRFLLPELKQKNFEVVFQQAGDGVQLVIYKKQ